MQMQYLCVNNGIILYSFNFELDFSYVKTQIKFEEEKIKPNTFCRLLHHLNPYLKLGPFKEEQISVKPYSDAQYLD